MFVFIEKMLFCLIFKQMFLLNHSKIIWVFVPEYGAICSVAIGRSSRSEVRCFEIKWVLPLSSEAIVGNMLVTTETLNFFWCSFVIAVMCE